MFACYLLLAIASTAYAQSPAPSSATEPEVAGPIDIDTSMQAYIHAPLQYKNYFSSPTTNKFFKGKLVYDEDMHSVMWYPNGWSMAHLVGGKNYAMKCPNIRRGPFGGEKFTHAYYLWKVQWTWGAVGQTADGTEHAFNGLRYAVEMQMIHVENEFIKKDGSVDWEKAAMDEAGVAVISVLFRVDNMKPQNQRPINKIDDAIWEHNHANPEHHGQKPMAKHSRPGRSVSVEDQDDMDHDISMQNLEEGLKQFSKENRRAKRDVGDWHVHVRLNVGAFLRKSTRNGGDKIMSTYFTYKGPVNDAPTATLVIFQRVLPIAQVQANAFASLGHNSFREIAGEPGPCEVQHLIHDHIGTAWGPMQG